MTSSVPWARWRMYLVLVLVCQTVRRVEGHPRAFTKPASQDTESSSTQDTEISKLIKAAYDKQELLQPEQWSRQTDDHVVTRSLERDTSRQPEYYSNDGQPDYYLNGGQSEYYLNDGISTPGERRLLEASTTRINSDEIVFPSDGRVSPPIPSPSVSTCHKSIFCENVIDYPRQLVNEAIARNVSLRFLETVDPMPDIEQRIDTTDEVPLCRYREQVVYPQTAQNKEKQWLFIVNQDNLKQGIRIEVCLNEGQECNMIQGFAEGYKTSCKQKFIYRELAAVTSNGNIIKDQFRFPSSCCCHVKFTGDPTVRLGLGLNLRFSNRTTAATTASKTRWP